MPGQLAAELSLALHDLEANHRLRSCPELAGVSRCSPRLDGEPIRAFCSNDYLDLACHPDLARAAAAAASREGFGAGASRLVAGDFPSHRQLENALAEFLGQQAALLFPSGYQTNIGLITALAGPGDLVASDSLNHASIIDGCRLSRATVMVYDHADADAAERALAYPGHFRRRILVTESVFSMDGDVAPLVALRAAADRCGAFLLVDEAHALGVLGPSGRGICSDRGVRADAIVGTLGKSFGSAGGFVAGPQPLRAWLLNRARSFIYSTAQPPSVAAAALAGLRIAAGPEGDQRRSRLHASVRQLRELLAPRQLTALPSDPTPITPIIVGPDATALDLSARLHRRGLFVPAIRPPTVPEGTARLRVTLSAAHTSTDVSDLANAILEALS